MARAEGSQLTDPAATAVESTMFRALAVLRVVLLLNAVGLAWYRRANPDHPAAAAAVIGVLIVWTAIAVVTYARPAWRTPALLVLDLLITAAAILVSLEVKGPQMRATLPGFWVAGVVFAWALHWRWQGGFVAGAVVSICDLLVRAEITQTNYANVFLLVIGGPIVGFLAGLLIDLARDRARAEHAAAAATERARLARVVHDGVLQVLTLVQRKGAEAGGEFAELARLAAEQERALRALVQQAPASAGPSGTVDLVRELTRVATVSPPRVHYTASVEVLFLDRDRADEVVAAVGECVANVARHVSTEADAWVLLEDLGDQVQVTVRDDGPGIPEGRLDSAVREGRIGVAESVRGRIAALGGESRLFSEPGRGTEWELSIPKEAPA